MLGTPFEVIIAGICGGYAGSLAALVGIRTARGESAWGRSHCDSCAITIPLLWNVPVLSWLLLRGRCRECRSSIGSAFLLAELVCALAWAGITAVWGAGLGTGVAVVEFTWLMMAIFGTGYRGGRGPEVEGEEASEWTPSPLSTQTLLWYVLGLALIACLGFFRAMLWLAFAPWGALAGGGLALLVLLPFRKGVGTLSWLVPGALATGALGSTGGVAGSALVLLFVAIGLLAGRAVSPRPVLIGWILVGLGTQVWPIGYSQGGLVGVALVLAAGLGTAVMPISHI